MDEQLEAVRAITLELKPLGPDYAVFEVTPLNGPILGADIALTFSGDTPHSTRLRRSVLNEPIRFAPPLGEDQDDEAGMGMDELCREFTGVKVELISKSHGRLHDEIHDLPGYWRALSQARVVDEANVLTMHDRRAMRLYERDVRAGEQLGAEIRRLTATIHNATRPKLTAVKARRVRVPLVVRAAWLACHAVRRARR